MGLKFNVNKYAIDNAYARIKAATVSEHTALRKHRNTSRGAHKKAYNIKNKNKTLTSDNREFLRLIASK